MAMENLGITKEQADKLADEYIKEPTTKLHLLESEAIMRALAKKLGEDEEVWGIIGLLHDIDWDLTKNDQQNHCVKCQEILKQAGASDFLIETIQSHGYENEMIPELKNKKRETKIQYCLVAAETLTGLIFASALMQPDKKLASVQLKSLKKKFNNKGFAAKCNRELIRECEKAGIPIDEFLEIGLTALQGISGKLGL
jgi:putative nucleotidyltransferase with HDIG domain